MTAYEFCIETARGAGSLLLQEQESFSVSTKDGDPRNLLTSADLAVNTYLIDAIRKEFPDDGIYSEEGGELKSANRMWALDPIDGTSNFARGIPHFAVCLARIEDGVPTVGAVYNPKTNELFSFEKGRGAFLNEKPIRVSEEVDLTQSHILLHAGRKPELWAWGGESYTKLLAHALKTTNLAGSALDLCYVAAGRVEAAVYGRLTLRDIAAAVGILTEAGGIVTSEGNATSLSDTPQQKVIASNNREILSSLLRLV